MTLDEFEQLKNWFYTYTNSFVSEAATPEPYMLKQKHTKRVCDNIDMLSDSLGLSPKERIIAHATALVHDTGRFPQFKTYETFSDPLSKNHAALGVAVLVKEGLPGNIPTAERQLILRAVALHNRPGLPSNLSADLLQVTKLLRDADKIDIYKVMTTLYISRNNERQNFITHNLLNDKKIPLEIVDMIISGQRILYSQVETLNGFKLFQLSMIFDLNFHAAFETIKQQGVVRAILASMPESSHLDVLERVLTDYIDDKIRY